MSKTAEKKPDPPKISVPLWGSGEKKAGTGATCWRREELVQGTDTSKMKITEKALNKQLNMTVSKLSERYYTSRH